ncbi:glycosyltransferase family 4 protein [Seonamhaeicola maritimus]|uniref:glycosyltransferase family 4 protein n=1 Tax=Seonamhaeicola maritimus TaxID=2591822 RepID=UPI002495A601|nr:glycosyltransferase family 1 protein [Seonamhaeicola maritimus]
MRIGIEAQRLFRPHKHGMDIVARELILNLQVIDKENDYFIFVKPDQDKSAIKSTANFKIVEIPGGPYPWWEQFKLPRIAKSYNCDILHCTSNTAPCYKNIPLITTLHDIIYMEASMLSLLFNKASLYQKFGNLYRRIIVSKVIKNSRRLITVSNFEKENITKYFKLKHKEIKAVHNGVNKKFTVNMDADYIARVKSKYKLPENYFLHIANKDPRKNTKKVLMAFKDFLERTTSKQKLLMLGCKDADLKISLNEIGAIDLYNHIILTGYVSDEDLPVIYKLSQLLLFPSLREGFGIPIIEAMACGVPVITSNTSSMPEVAGNAAHLIDPNKIEDISSGMLKIVSDQNYKNMLIQRGLKRSKEFSWKKMAFQVLEQYKQLYKEINT